MKKGPPHHEDEEARPSGSLYELWLIEQGVELDRRQRVLLRIQAAFAQSRRERVVMWLNT